MSGGVLRSWRDPIPFPSPHNNTNNPNTTTKKNRYREAIRTFVVVLDLYFKHLEQVGNEPPLVPPP